MHCRRLESRASIVQWLILLSLLSTTEIQAVDKLEAGLDAYHHGDYHVALQQWHPLANQGDGKAQLFLAFMFRRGKGVDKSPMLAAKWYRAAAKQGNANAQYELGLMHELGLGVKKDHEEAVYWYGLAEDQGYCPGELPAGGILGEQ